MRRYLSSTESRLFSGVWTCDLIGWDTFSNTGKPVAMVKIWPPIPGNAIGETEDVNELAIATRLEGDDLSFDDDRVHYVHIAVPSRTNSASTVNGHQFSSIAWGELYPTFDAAQNHTLRRL